MEGNENLLLIIMIVMIVLGIAGTVAYYFSRFYVRSDYDRDIERAKAELAKKELATSDEPGVDQEVVAAVQPELAPADLATSLAKTRQGLWGRIKDLVGQAALPTDLLEGLEEILFTSDLGPATVQRLLSAVELKLDKAQLRDVESVRRALRTEMLDILSKQTSAVTVIDAFKAIGQSRPQVWLVVGVNGAGKTTTIGKLANILARDGKKVLVAAGDTFRAAAGEQLRIWTERANVEIFSPPGVTDSAAVAFEACQRAKASGADVVIIDTAGRLHTQKNLMEELKKVKRVLQKVSPEAPQETLLVLDANSGQNAMVQAREFNQAIDITGVVLTKMDGTAKGGIALSIALELGLQVRLIGIGEGIADLRPFAANEFVESIL